MRLWSIHPKYLDVKGLLALWREGLLAKKVLEGKTKGYKNHPQLIRFKNTKNPVKHINEYLYGVLIEAKKRGYNFDESKIKHYSKLQKINVKKGQIEFEMDHLKKKLRIRDKNKLKEIQIVKKIEAHPFFKIINGEKEE